MPDDRPAAPPRKPLRTLDLWALGVGIVVCGQYFGWNAGLLGGGPVGMLLASLVVCLLFLAWVLTLAELAVALPRAGGPLDYGRRAGGPLVGPWLGFLMAWSMLLECLFGLIATALATAWYVVFLLEPETPETVVLWAGLATVVAFFLVHARGVKEQSFALLLMTCAALVGLLIYWAVVGSHFAWGRAWPADDPLVGKGWKAVLDAVPYALWWLIIIEGVALAAESTHEPHRCLPRGLVWAMVTVIGMVAVTLTVTAGAVPWDTVTGEYPLATVMKAVTGGEPTWLVRGFGAIALFGLIASYHGLLFGTSRQAFGLGRDGYLPGWLGKIHPTTQTPVAALAACSAVAAGFVVASVWYKDAIYVAILVAGLASLVLYLLSMGCLLWLRWREPGLFHAYRAPLGGLLPVAVILLAGLALVVYVGIDHGGTVLLLGAALYALGLGYFAFRWRAIPAGETAPVAPAAPPRPSPSPGLDCVAGAALLVALLAVGWIVASTLWPGALAFAPVEVEVAVCAVVFAAALVLVCAVALVHTRPEGGGP